MKQKSLFLQGIEAISNFTEIVPIGSPDQDVDLSENDLAELQTRLEKIRSIVDLDVTEEYGASRKFISGEESYPVGYCNHITDRVGDLLEEDEWIKTIIGNGIFKRLYGVWEEHSMQNALQMGGWMLDVAADAFKEEDRSVVIRRLDESPFRNLRSIEDYAQVLEKGHGVEVIPNRYLPHFSLMYPLIMYSKNNLTKISLVKELVNPCMGGLVNGGSDNIQFLTDSSFSEKRLSPEQESLIEKTLTEKGLEAFLFDPNTYDGEMMIDWYSAILNPQNDEEMEDGKKLFREILDRGQSMGRLGN